MSLLQLTLRWNGILPTCYNTKESRPAEAETQIPNKQPNNPTRLPEKQALNRVVFLIIHYKSFLRLKTNTVCYKQRHIMDEMKWLSIHLEVHNICTTMAWWVCVKMNHKLQHLSTVSDNKIKSWNCVHTLSQLNNLGNHKMVRFISDSWVDLIASRDPHIDRRH